LQQLKRRTPFVVQRDNFAVNDRVLDVECGDRISYFRELLSKILLVPRQDPSGIEATSCAFIGSTKSGRGAEDNFTGSLETPMARRFDLAG
jgi:hypothetical protein